MTSTQMITKLDSGHAIVQQCRERVFARTARKHSFVKMSKLEQCLDCHLTAWLLTAKGLKTSTQAHTRPHTSQVKQQLLLLPLTHQPGRQSVTSLCTNSLVWTPP